MDQYNLYDNGSILTVQKVVASPKYGGRYDVTHWSITTYAHAVEIFNESTHTDFKAPPCNGGTGSSPALAIQTNIPSTAKYDAWDILIYHSIKTQYS